MKELVVISGKGGTGKTSIAASFAALSENAVFVDCDVDAADLHLILKPAIKRQADFTGGKKAQVLPDKCIGCGRCLHLCRFDAVYTKNNKDNKDQKLLEIDQIECEGCGVCAHFCPVNAIRFEDVVNGRWFISETRFGPMVHAQLGPAQQNSGKLASLLRKQAKIIAEENNLDLIIVDGSPGIGCPVIASITGADLVLIVTEPTLTALHDMERVIKLTEHFNIPTAVCINKFDIHSQITENIEKSAARANLPLLGRIRLDNAVTKAQLAEKSIVEFSNNTTCEQIKKLWKSVLKLIQEKETDK